MRVWDIPANLLCDKHLLGQHREIHAIQAMLLENKGGAYLNHPEVKRWKEHLFELSLVHFLTSREMNLRQFQHKSPMSFVSQPTFEKLSQWQSTEKQIAILKEKGCNCSVSS